ncbi:MAG: hypothetical protein ABR537_08980 [Gemmatimonadales bacterium]
MRFTRVARRASPDQSTVSLTVPGQRPRDDELDMFGITHRGKVRKDNQDHFLLATVHPQIHVLGTSLPADRELPLKGSRLGTVLLGGRRRWIGRRRGSVARGH